MNPVFITERIETALPGTRCHVVDMTGTGDHFEARIASESFRGRSLLERHRMIYAIFPAEIASDELHALTMKTLTPEEAATA